MANGWQRARRLGIAWLAAAVVLVAAGRGAAAPPEARREMQVELPRQSELLQRALADLLPAQPGSRHLYFVGFAGYGYQAVFKREVLAARKLFDERFETRGRSVALINHPSTINDVPLATRENLEQVLRAVGRLMDARNDTLFLFLTSHGDRSLLAVEMPYMTLEQLTPAALKAMLGRSGISNRVIVVSACHAGSFIPALADPRTRRRAPTGPRSGARTSVNGPTSAMPISTGPCASRSRSSARSSRQAS